MYKMEKVILIVLATLLFSCSNRNETETNKPLPNRYRVEIQTDPGISSYQLWLVKGNDTINHIATMGNMFYRRLETDPTTLKVIIHPSTPNWDAINLSVFVENLTTNETHIDFNQSGIHQNYIKTIELN